MFGRWLGWLNALHQQVITKTVNQRLSEAFIISAETTRQLNTKNINDTAA